MKKTVNIPYEKTLSEPVTRFLELFFQCIGNKKIEAIFITGSQAWGTARPDSDVDAIVIVNDDYTESEIWFIRDCLDFVNQIMTNQQGSIKAPLNLLKVLGLVDGKLACKISELKNGNGAKLKGGNRLVAIFVPQLSYLYALLDNSIQVYGTDMSTFLPEKQFGRVNELIKGLFTFTIRNLFSLFYIFRNNRSAVLNSYKSFRLTATHCYYVRYKVFGIPLSVQTKRVLEFGEEFVSKRYYRNISNMFYKRDFNTMKLSSSISFIFWTHFFIVKIYIKTIMAIITTTDP